MLPYVDQNDKMDVEGIGIAFHGHKHRKRLDGRQRSCTKIIEEKKKKNVQLWNYEYHMNFEIAVWKMAFAGHRTKSDDRGGDLLGASDRPTTKVKDAFERCPKVCNLPRSKCCRMKWFKCRSRIKCTNRDSFVCPTARYRKKSVKIIFCNIYKTIMISISILISI